MTCNDSTQSETSFQTQDIPVPPSFSLTPHPQVRAQAYYNGSPAEDVRDICSAAFYGTSLSPSQSRIVDAIVCPLQVTSFPFRVTFIDTNPVNVLLRIPSQQIAKTSGMSPMTRHDYWLIAVIDCSRYATARSSGPPKDETLLRHSILKRCPK